MVAQRDSNMATSEEEQEEKRSATNWNQSSVTLIFLLFCFKKGMYFFLINTRVVVDRSELLQTMSNLFFSVYNG